jgi:hypothetical protein
MSGPDLIAFPRLRGKVPEGRKGVFLFCGAQ